MAINKYLGLSHFLNSPATWWKVHFEPCVYTLKSNLLNSIVVAYHKFDEVCVKKKRQIKKKTGLLTKFGFQVN